MRSRTERAIWAIAAVALVGGAVAAWWTSEQWLPQAEPWVQQTWRKVTRPGPDTLPQKQKAAAQASEGTAPAPALAATPRKCVQNGRTLYTDQPCPAGSQEKALDGAVTSSP